jgi:predicted secreted protein with PEFG-CTERM motif
MRVFGGNLPCYATVENNIITGNSYGIGISLTDVNGGLGQQYCPTILNNTVSGNSIGIYLNGFGYTATPIIKYNNLQSNSNYSFDLQESNNADLSNNWWGTTNQQAINQSIYDFKDDFNLGVVTFTPFLTAPNPQAPSAFNPIVTPSPTATSTPTQNPTSTPTSSPTLSSTPTSASTPTVPEFPMLAIPVLLSILSVAVILSLRKQRSGEQ